MSESEPAGDTIARQIVKLASREAFELDYLTALQGEKKSAAAIKFYAVAPTIGALVLSLHEHFDNREKLWAGLTAGVISLVGVLRAKGKKDDYVAAQRTSVRQAAELSQEMGIDQEPWTLQALRQTD